MTRDILFHLNVIGVEDAIAFVKQRFTNFSTHRELPIKQFQTLLPRERKIFNHNIFLNI